MIDFHYSAIDVEFSSGAVGCPALMKIGTRAMRSLAVATLALVLVAPNGVKASDILIDAGNSEEVVTFTFSQFEGGFSVNGSTPTSGGSFTFGEGSQLNFTGHWLDRGQATPVSRTVYWVEPQDPTVISEILLWSITPSGPSGLATISGFFQADGLGTLPPSVYPADIIVERFNASHDPFRFLAPFLTGRIITGAGDRAPLQTVDVVGRRETYVAVRE